jgi:hypothetical protein
MTPAEFLAMAPLNHPDFVCCTDPRCESGNKVGRKDPALCMPNLVELIRRIGGPDAVPEAFSGDNPVPLFGLDDPRSHVVWHEAKGAMHSALLKDLRSRRVYARLYRMGNGLFVDRWHPKDEFLEAIFDVPADWSASAWGLPSVMSEDSDTASYDLDRLAAETLDYWIGSIQKATETYVHIRRDRFVF